MRKMSYIILLSIFSWPLIINGQDTGTGANFLKIGIGPRQIGLGGTFTGVADDIYSIYWNPAGLGRIRNWEFSLMLDKHFADIYIGSLSGAHQFRLLGSRKFTVGMSLFHLGMADWNSMEDGSITNQPMGSASNTVFTLSLAQRIDWAKVSWLGKHGSIGMNVKYISSKLVDENAKTLAYDFGLHYKMELIGRPFSFGIAIQNIGKPIKFIQEGSPIPLAVRGGASYKFGHCKPHQLLLASDVAKYRGSDWKISFGGEYWFRNFVGIRSGYTYYFDDDPFEEQGYLSFSLGYRFDAKKIRLMNTGSQFDAAYSHFNTLGNTFKGAYTLYADGPEPFRLLEPPNEKPFCFGTPILFKWEEAPCSSPCDKIIYYRILVDFSLDGVKEAVKILKKNPGSPLNIIASDSTMFLSTILVMPNLPDSTFYWTVVAVDQNLHTRRANEIRKFVIRKPDIIIRELALETTRDSETLVECDEPVETKLRLVLKNIGCCDAINFSVILKDSLLCPLDYNEFYKIFIKDIDYVFIDTLKSGDIDTKFVEWEVFRQGIHNVYAKADFLDNVVELNEYNNESYLLSATVSKGFVTIDTFSVKNNTFKTSKVISELCEIPLVPLVFFDSLDTSVPERFYREKPGKSFPILKEIAERIKRENDENIILKIAGYIDPDTENRTQNENRNLALKRAKSVKAIMAEIYDIDASRIEIDQDKDVTKKRIEKRSPDEEISEIDLQMLSEENRRVELIVDSPSIEETLFHPKTICIRPGFNKAIQFYSRIDVPFGCSAWQLEIVTRQKNPVVTLPFKISENNQQMVDTLTWFGYNKDGNLVKVNENYLYRLKIADKAENMYYSKWKPLRIEADSVIFEQRYVHLMKFDQYEPIFNFSNKQLEDIATKLIEDTTVYGYLLGFTCVIGREQRLRTLAYDERSKAFLDSFKNTIKKVLSRRNEYSEEKYGRILAKVDTVAYKHAEDYIRNTHYSEWYKEPLSYRECCFNSDVLYGNNSLPEGRNYNRRVEIVLIRKN